jgi:DNA-directed RNA polymerase subunit RPC12/RpoP
MERGIMCMKCGKRFPTSQMKYLHDAKNMMCLDCVEKIKKPLNQQPMESGEKEAPKKLRYKCLRCKHVFMLKDGFSKICPFCSNQNLEKQEWNSDLDNLISESSQRIYDH